MRLRSPCSTVTTALVGIALVCGCAPPNDGESGTGGQGSGNNGGGTGGASSPGSSGGSGTASGGAPSNGSGGAAANSGGAAGGRNGSGGRAATGGAPVVTGSGGQGPLTPLDCGPIGWAVENHGPPANRVNYGILADGYTAATLETTLMTHINNYMTKRFSAEIGQPYGRYRNFVNICVFKLVSQSDGIGNGPTALSCSGDDTSRLANCNNQAVSAAFTANTPSSFPLDWRSVVLNNSRWWNSGGTTMLWSGGNQDGPGAALHEGGHGFHQLADEYGGTGRTDCMDEHTEVNSTADPVMTGGKWDMWMGLVQKGMAVPDMGATGMQGAFNSGFSQGSRYCNVGQYRPSSNSMMNSLFGTNVNTSFNAVSREQMVMSIWRAVVPIDSTEPPAGAANNPAMLKVNVIDPAVINVDWTVDGVTTTNGGTTLSTASLASGTHTISAKAYDNATTDLVKYRGSTCPPSVTGNYCHRTSWSRSQQTVTWTVTKP